MAKKPKQVFVIENKNKEYKDPVTGRMSVIQPKSNKKSEKNKE